MKKGKEHAQPVTLRPKGNKTPPELTEEPAYRKLAGMIEAGEIDRARTVDHLKRGARHDQTNRPI